MVNLDKHQYPAVQFRGKLRELFDYFNIPAGAGKWGILPINQTVLSSTKHPISHLSKVPDTHRELMRFIFIHCFNKEEDFQKAIKNDNGRNFEFSCQFGRPTDIAKVLSDGSAVDLYEKGIKLNLRRFPSKSSNKDVIINETLASGTCKRA